MTLIPKKGIAGYQIDTVIARADRVINLLEMKCSNGLYTITKAVHESVRKKANDFVVATGTRDGIHLTFVTLYGLVWNAYAGDVQSQNVAEDLFKE